MLTNANLEKFIQKNLLYITEEQRQRTFKKWVFSDKQPCSAVKMAEAGFIFIGDKDSPDAVKCFLCGKTLDGWDRTDDPWKEHIKHSPNCSFAKLQKTHDSLLLEEFLYLKEELIKKTTNKYYDLIKEYAEVKLNEIEKLEKIRIKKISKIIV